MSYLDHFCLHCTHQWMVHTDTRCLNGICKCNLDKAMWAPPRVIRTRWSAAGEENPDVTRPGDWVFYKSLPTCNCVDCEEAWIQHYAEVTP